MKERFENCEPTIINNDLMSKGNDYMTSDIIKEQCVCAKRKYCFEIVRLLKCNKREEAIDLIGQMQKGTDA